MSSGVLLLLIIAVWLFVLIPLFQRGAKPVHRAGRALDETRVLHSGGSEFPETLRRHPKISAADVHRPAEEDSGALSEGYEVVLAERDEDPEEAAAGGRAAPGGGDAGARATAGAGGRPASAPEVISGEIVHELESPDADAPVGDARGIAEPVDLASGDDSGRHGDVVESGEYIEPAESGEYVGAAEPADDSRYSAAEAYMGPEEFCRGTFQSAGAEGGSGSEGESAAGMMGAGPGMMGVGPGTPHAVARPEGSTSPLDEGGDLTEDELRFAAARRGRGGWDPEADAHVSADRYQRRRWTLSALGGLAVIGWVLAVVFSGWWWSAAVVATAAVATYLVALRSQVRQEQALRRRRIRQLRRAALGVRHRDDERLRIPRQLRRPGAIVLERDDESPDFHGLGVGRLPSVGERDEEDAEVIQFPDARIAG